MDSTASVNLITAELAKDIRKQSAKNAQKKTGRAKGFQAEQLLENDDEVSA